MNYAAIKNCDIANGPGVRVSLFVSGCTHHCKGCFQPETWDFGYGQPFKAETQETIFSLLEPWYIAGLTILGGEPMEIGNQDALLPFVDRVRLKFPEKSIWLYSGYTYERLMRRSPAMSGTVTRKLLSLVDILVDGPFVEEKKNIGLQFCGSENQRIVDLRQTEEQAKIVLWEERRSEQCERQL